MHFENPAVSSVSFALQNMKALPLGTEFTSGIETLITPSPILSPHRCKKSIPYKNWSKTRNKTLSGRNLSRSKFGAHDAYLRVSTSEVCVPVHRNITCTAENDADGQICWFKIDLNSLKTFNSSKSVLASFGNWCIQREERGRERERIPLSLFHSD